MSCVDLCEKKGCVDNNYFNIYKFPIHIDLNFFYDILRVSGDNKGKEEEEEEEVGCR
jgi:hypothetical protein